jgi:mannose-6-phosphate isomerase-like protein (cupin superfamily)
MKTLTSLALAAALSATSFAADPTGALLWTAGQFQELDKKLSAKLDETRAGTEQIIQKNNYNAIVFHREGPSYAEIHQKLADFLIVRAGEATIVVGGKAMGAKPSGPGELRGKSLEGGTRYKVSIGDVLYIPANTPHQTIVEKGKSMTALVIKVEPR